MDLEFHWSWISYFIVKANYYLRKYEACNPILYKKPLNEIPIFDLTATVLNFWITPWQFLFLTVDHKVVKLSEVPECVYTGKVLPIIATDEDTEEPLSLLYCFIRDVGIQNALRYLTETNLNMLKPGDYSTLEMTKLITRACLNEMYPFGAKCYFEVVDFFPPLFITNTFLEIFFFAEAVS